MFFSLKDAMFFRAFCMADLLRYLVKKNLFGQSKHNNILSGHLDFECFCCIT